MTIVISQSLHYIDGGKMNVEMKMYFACAIQGEGNISLYKRKDKRTSKGFYLEPRIEVTNTEKDWIDFLKTKANIGHLHKDDSPSRRRKGYKTSYRWIVCALNDVIFLLEGVKDFLIGKKIVVANLLLEYCQLRYVLNRSYSRKNGRISKGNQINYSQRMIEIYNEMKKLNRRKIER